MATSQTPVKAVMESWKKLYEGKAKQLYAA